MCCGKVYAWSQIGSLRSYVVGTLRAAQSIVGWRGHLLFSPSTIAIYTRYVLCKLAVAAAAAAAAAVLPLQLALIAAENLVHTVALLARLEGLHIPETWLKRRENEKGGKGKTYKKMENLYIWS